MRRSLTVASVLLSGLMLATPALAQKTLRWGTEASYPPYEYTSASGEIIGFDVDLVQAMCAEMKVKCTFVDQAFDGLITGLQAKKFDAIAAAMTITAEREKAVLFTKKLYTDVNMFVGKSGQKIDTSMAGLKGKSIAVQQGTVQDKYLSKHAAGATIKRYKSIEDAFSDLLSGRADLVFADGPVCNDFLKSPRGKGLEIVGSPVAASADPEVLGKGKGYAVRKTDTQLAQDLNKAYDTLIANGTAKKIADKYFKYDVYGK